MLACVSHYVFERGYLDADFTRQANDARQVYATWPPSRLRVRDELQRPLLALEVGEQAHAFAAHLRVAGLEHFPHGYSLKRLPLGGDATQDLS